MSDEFEPKIRPDIKRLAEIITVDEYFKLRENDIACIVDALSQFIVGEDGNYLSQEAGRAVLGKIKLKSVRGLFDRFMSETEEIAVPLASEITSALP